MTQLGRALRIGTRSIAARVIPPRYWLQLAVRSNLRHGEPELQLLPRLLDSTRAFIDVGGNVGVYAAVAEQFSEHVHVFEPHPALAQRLRKSLRPTSQVLQVALSDRAGEAVLWAPEALSRSSLERGANGALPVNPVTVSTARLDDFDIPAVGLIKIDVEGHELAVLRGAQATITRDRPAILVEIEERHHRGSSVGVFDYLANLGYRGFFMHRGKLRRLEEYDFENLQRPENAKSPHGGHHPDYINNFIFVHTFDTARLARLSDGLSASQ